jgi:hypothetical protein
MTYRPQYAYPFAPLGKEDETFHYSFDSTTTPLLGQAIAAGGQSNDIQLPTEQDAPFFCRGIKIQLGTAASNLYVQLRTPHGDYINVPYVPLSNWATGTGLAPAGQLDVPLPDEIECPPGSAWTLFLYNPTLGSVNPPAITLYGVKQRKCGSRRMA